MEVCSLDWGAIGGFTGAGATLISAIIASCVAWSISEKWRDQKGSEVLSVISKDCYTNLDKFKDLARETIDSTHFQLLNSVVSNDPMKNFNVKYSYDIDKLKDLKKTINRDFEIIKKYKLNDKEFINLVDTFSSFFGSLDKYLEDMHIVIISSEIVKEYDGERVDDIKNSNEFFLDEYFKFIDNELKNHLKDYIFHVK